MLSFPDKVLLELGVSASSLGQIYAGEGLNILSEQPFSRKFVNAAALLLAKELYVRFGSKTLLKNSSFPPGISVDNFLRWFFPTLYTEKV